jgi:hypothetical protein
MSLYDCQDIVGYWIRIFFAFYISGFNLYFEKIVLIIWFSFLFELAEVLRTPLEVWLSFLVQDH